MAERRVSVNEVESTRLDVTNLFMLAEHIRSNFFILILKPTDSNCFLKQPLGSTQNKNTGKPGVHPPALDLAANTSATSET